MKVQAVNKPRRRRFRFTLRALLVMMLLFGCLLIPVVVRLREAREQAAVVESISRLGGSVYYDYQCGDNGHLWFEFEGAQPPGPQWLRSYLGKDYFCRIRVVVLKQTQLTNRDLRKIKGRSIKVLDLSNTQISNDGLEHLKVLTNLEELDVSRTDIDDQGLELLKDRRSLKRLDIFNTPITDPGVRQLQKALPNCSVGYIPAHARKP